jgi:hypothetical protein
VVLVDDDLVGVELLLLGVEVDHGLGPRFGFSTKGNLELFTTGRETVDACFRASRCERRTLG